MSLPDALGPADEPNPIPLIDEILNDSEQFNFDNMTHENVGRIHGLFRQGSMHSRELCLDPVAWAIKKYDRYKKGTEVPDEEHYQQLLERELKTLYPGVEPDKVEPVRFGERDWRKIYPATFEIKGHNLSIWYIERHFQESGKAPALQLIVSRDDPNQPPRSEKMAKIVMEKSQLESPSRELVAPGGHRRLQF